MNEPLSPRRKMLATKHGKATAKHFAEWYRREPENFLKGIESVPEMSGRIAMATVRTSLRDKRIEKQQMALARRVAKAECRKLLALLAR